MTFWQSVEMWFARALVDLLLVVGVVACVVLLFVVWLLLESLWDWFGDRGRGRRRGRRP